MTVTSESTSFIGVSYSEIIKVINLIIIILIFLVIIPYSFIFHGVFGLWFHLAFIVFVTTKLIPSVFLLPFHQISMPVTAKRWSFLSA